MPRKRAHPTWIVTTSGQRPLAEVAADLKKAGFEIGTVMNEIGIITGRAAPAKVDALRKTEGVADIAADREIDIGPPGSPDTW
jgi:hypothetical protein